LAVRSLVLFTRRGGCRAALLARPETKKAMTMNPSWPDFSDEELRSITTLASALPPSNATRKAQLNDAFQIFNAIKIQVRDD
jgi:hypothetical protein